MEDYTWGGWPEVVIGGLIILAMGAYLMNAFLALWG